MTRKTTFLKAIDQLYETAHLLNQYENIPRKYGTDDELYMVEAHMINLIGVNKVKNIAEIAKQKLETYDTKDFENIEHFLNMISENLNYLINDTRNH